MKENPIEIIDTKITDKWGVYWDEMETARDFLQNFFDANPVNDIRVTAEGATVSVFGPATFDYRELFYLGSDKSDDPATVGHYGEGWKASVVNAMRNFGCTIEVKIKNRKLEFCFEGKEIGQSVKQIVLCKIYNQPEINGTLLIVRNCTEKLRHELLHALHYFYYPQNPVLDSPIYINEQAGIEVYRSNHKTEGYIFYKRLMRAKLDAPIVVICNTPIQAVEGATRHDRDRKSFSRDIQTLILKTVFCHIHNKNDLIRHLENWWVEGHWILALLTQTYQGQHRSRYNFNFPDLFYADVKSSHGSLDLAIEIRQIMKEFEEKNYIACPGYLYWLGMKSPLSIAQERIKDRQEKARAAAVRKLTLRERQALVALWDFVEELSPEMFRWWTHAAYIVCNSDDLIEEVQKNCTGSFVLKADFFNQPFFYALSVMLQKSLQSSEQRSRWANVIPRLVELIYQNTDDLMKTKQFYEATWEEIRQKIQSETLLSQRNIS